MKSKINFPGICTMLLCLCFSKNIVAQQIKATSQDAVTHNGQPANTYTYKVFEAPNKMYGYDILQNGKGIFHQPAAIIPTNNTGLNQSAVPQTLSSANDPRGVVNGFSKEEFAQNAAMLSIEKIKKRSAPALTNDEMKQAINSNSNTIIKH
ncbi:MAG: hypothetical protein ABI472_24340 [Ginsengibacter sp.]